MIGSSHTFGHSFGPDPATPSERRVRSSDAHKARLNALPAECSAWKDRLTMQGLEGLAVVVRAYKAAGDAACIVHRSDIASAIGVTPDGADRILGRLVEIGAVERIGQLSGDARFRPVPTPPASPPIVAQKAQRAPAAEPIRKVAGVTDPRLKAGLLGVRNHEEPPKVNLLKGVVGASR